MNQSYRITMDPDICHGKPTIRGLRYPVKMILQLLSSGMTIDDILTDYEDLEKEDILEIRSENGLSFRPCAGIPCFCAGTREIPAYAGMTC